MFAALSLMMPPTPDVHIPILANRLGRVVNNTRGQAKVFRAACYAASSLRIRSRYCRPVFTRVPPRNSSSYTPPIIV